MIDYNFRNFSYSLADYLYNVAEHKSKFVMDCKNPEETKNVSEIFTKLYTMDTENHSANENALADRILTMMTAIYLYASLADEFNATELCVEPAQIIRDYTDCVYARDHDERKDNARELQGTVNYAFAGLRNTFWRKSETDVKSVAYAVAVRCALQNVYKDIEAYIRDVLVY